jgi:magnesium-transporting ATPase (P-type)
MDLDRQELPPPRKPQPPQRVPESNPPLLGDWFIYISVVILVCGVVAISAVELGSALDSWLVRGPALIGAALLVVVSADAAVRVWRSAWAWLPVDRGRGLFRFVWAAVLVAILVASLAVIVILLTL